jgi:DNA-binding NarL/FixJ family response regulator
MNRAEREESVIQLYREGKTTREIARVITWRWWI